VVVGAGLAGAKVCEHLRWQGYEGRITLLGSEPHAAYDRPPLTKAVLMRRRDDTTLNVNLGALDVVARFGATALRLRATDHIVETSAGEVSYDRLVIATGARPITLPGNGLQHVVRTIDDALRLREALRAGRHVVIIGASWIGAEVATAALAHGCRVTCVEAGPTVLHIALGAVGSRLEPWWASVDLRLGAAVEQIDDGMVHLADGTVIPVDVVVAGVGARPETGWLSDADLELDGGVVVDEHLRGGEDIVAIGDVAAWWSRRFSRRMRVEHWDNAVASASVAAATLLDPEDERAVHDPIPYFWSDQFGHKLQFIGSHDKGSRLVIRSTPANEHWSAAWLDRDDCVTAMLFIDCPRDLVKARDLIAARHPVRPDLIADGHVPLSAFLPSA
jgi:3-phenylpropionate/trans-cinnamate dioxygenase ferredoxin reductase subunit